MANLDRDIAYFSLEIGLEASIPTYSGGLGILAGDTLRAAADLELPYVGVTLLYRGGYFSQRLGEGGAQRTEEATWSPESALVEMPPRVSVPLDGRDVYLRAFRTELVGVSGHRVPVYFLDTDMPANDEEACLLTRRLYGGDTDHRIRQEALLGIGGRRMLRAIGHDLGCFHMNEGHACFVTVELLSEHICRTAEQALDRDAVSQVRRRCVFTTHTPVEVGHDRFSIDRVRQIVGHHPVFERPDLYGSGDDVLNTTVLAMNLSKFSNAVARRHGEVSRAMFPGYPIEAITNGVHAATWACQPMRDLFDRHMPGWRASNTDLRLASRIPQQELLSAHDTAKRAMLAAIRGRVGVGDAGRLEPEVFTIVFSRRMTDYKRPAMLVSDVERLRDIARDVGRVQVVYAGKAHPHDGRGAEIIREIHGAARELGDDVPLVFIEDYDIELSKHLVAGADLWLNNPRPPLEASGTSGMKAAINGVPSLSTLDGWWLEGCVEGLTGWSIGSLEDDARTGDTKSMDRRHARALYDRLERDIVPLFYRDRARWAEIMRACIAVNGSFFTTERMVRDYALHAYTR